MLRLLRLLFVLIKQSFCTRSNLLLENMALRQQLAALKRRYPRPRIATLDKLFWVILRRFWPRWKHVLILVQPDTVVRWHRAGFALYWKWLSRYRNRAGRKCVSRELRELILRMATENPTWGAPRIHGELMMLGFDISERTVLRWMLKGPRKPEPAMHWAAFLANHREAIAAMDFFTMPMLTFEVLYCFFVIAHDRRRILHCDVTRHPSSEWVDHQLCEAFPYDSAPKYLILDRDSIFSVNVLNTVRCLGIKPVRTAFRSPWQNGIAERWVGNCRRDLLDHVIVLNKRHLKPLMNEYVCYYHDDRTHLGLDKETLQAARQEKVRKPAVELSLCPGSVACIIATIWRPKSLFRRIWIKAGNERLEMCTWPPVSGILGRSFQQICLLDFSVQTPLLRTNLTRHPTRPFLRSDLILARDRRTWCDDACS